MGTFEAIVKSTSPASGRSPRGEMPLFCLWDLDPNPTPTPKRLSPRASRLRATFFCQARQKKAKALLTSGAYRGTSFSGRSVAPKIGDRPRLRRSCKAQPRWLATAESGRWSTTGSACVPRGYPPGQIVFDRYPGSGKLARDKLLVSQRAKRFSAPQRGLTGNPASFARL